VRERALALAQRFEDHVERFREASWAVVSRPGAPAERYREALRWAEVACRLGPRDAGCRLTLGLAQYRAGRYKEAAETLTPLDLPPKGGVSHRSAMVGAFLAMTHHRTGNKVEARARLAPLRDVDLARMQHDKGDVDLARMGLSMEDLLGFLEEAEALIGPPDPPAPKGK
jgi:hypothetical protein